jgi:hypothetical protein
VPGRPVGRATGAGPADELQDNLVPSVSPGATRAPAAR